MAKAKTRDQSLMSRALKSEHKRLFGIALRRYTDDVHRMTVEAAHDLLRRVATEPADEAALQCVLKQAERDALYALISFLGDSDAMPLLTQAFAARVARKLTKRRTSRSKLRDQVILGVLRGHPQASVKDVVRALEAGELGAVDRDGGGLFVRGHEDHPISLASLDSVISRLRKSSREA